METIKKLFPYSFGAQDVKGLIVKIVVYLLASAVLGTIIGLIPVIGDIVSWVIGLYCTVGLIIAILDYLKVLK